MTNFQLSLIGICVLFLIVGVLVFAGILPGFRAPAGGAGGQVTLWGAVPADQMDAILVPFRAAHKSEFTLNYQFEDPRTLESALVNALAAGNGPDLVILPQPVANRQQDKLLPLPYESYPQANYRADFIREGELYLTPSGLLALPVAVDPLVLYVNEDLLTSGRLAQVPATWTDLQAAVKNLTVADAQGNITQSTIAIGQFSNINHAKDILTLLIMQAGNPIIVADQTGLRVTLADSLGYHTLPAAEALAFFNRFADTSNSLYSWNSSLPEARDAFARGILAFYLGYASELPGLQQQNPQLNISVAVVPQLAGQTNLTLGQLYGVSVTRGSKNPATALKVAALLAGPEGAPIIAAAYHLPSARSGLLPDDPSDAVKTVFNQSAILSRNWPDPDETATAKIFSDLVQAVAVRGVKADDAVSQAAAALKALLQK